MFVDAGHLSWALFFTLVFSAGLLLCADLLWRVIVMPTGILLGAVAVIWCVGLALIVLL